jgi:hypothetical protein
MGRPLRELRMGEPGFGVRGTSLSLLRYGKGSSIFCYGFNSTHADGR